MPLEGLEKCGSVGGMLDPLHQINQARWHRPFPENCEVAEGLSIPEQTGTLLAGFGELH